MSIAVEVRQGAYHDSVTLMQVSRAVAGTPGVAAALVAMATQLNLDLLPGMGFPAPAAGPNDLLVAVRGADEASLAAGLAAAEDRLRALGRRGGSGGTGTVTQAAPRSVSAAALADPGATVALVSVPGRAAFPEAMDALEAGLSVMLFSDNVPVEHEIRLKDEAARRGLLVMGPDCGTGLVAGVGLGFANVVRPGPVGVVAASGTGAQQLMCLLEAADVGVSHCLGLGGRDLSGEVAGRSARPALLMLDEDPGTELIVVVSKPPAPDVAEALAAFAETLDTPVQWALLGRGRPDLTQAAERAAVAVGGTFAPPRQWPQQRAPRAGDLRGLFSGGTLCDEAMVIAAESLGRIASNIPLQPDWAVPDAAAPSGHAMLDFGDDAMTQGRAHPMIDQELRLLALHSAAREASSAVLLLDVVLGHGAHPDPAVELAPAIAAARDDAASRHGHDLAVVVSLCGTAGDPQGLSRQAEALQAAGASVHLSNAAAAREAVALVERP